MKTLIRVAPLSAGLIGMILTITSLAGGSRAQASASCSPESVGVAIANFSFTPSTQFADVGDTVCWTWVEGFHSTTSSGGFWNSGQLSSPNTFEFTFSSSGIYTYSCTVHPSMQGTILVGLNNKLFLPLILR